MDFEKEIHRFFGSIEKKNDSIGQILTVFILNLLRNNHKIE